MIESLGLLFAVLGACLRTRRDLVVETLLLRHQLAVALQPRPRPPIRRRAKLRWILARRLFRDWRRHLVVVRPETAIRWHRRGWRLFRRWRSRARLGRPRVSPGVCELIATMVRENPTWGADSHENPYPRRARTGYSGGRWAP